MRIAIGADHGGFALKHFLIERMQEENHTVIDLGAHALDPADDYPDFAKAVSEKVLANEVERGIIVCGSGVGAAVVANKFRGIRAGLCHDTYSARQGVEHDDINVLCLGARVIGVELASEVVRAFLGARFSGENRHKRRLQKVLAIEASSHK